MSENRKPSLSSEEITEERNVTRNAFGRRALLKSAASAAVGATAMGLAGKIGAERAGAGPVHLQCGAGALRCRWARWYLDQKQYIHNMEIVSHLLVRRSAVAASAVVMWAKGTIVFRLAAIFGCERSQKSGRSE